MKLEKNLIDLTKAIIDKVNPDVILLISENEKEYKILKEKFSLPIILATTNKKLSKRLKNSVMLLAKNPSLRARVKNALALAFQKTLVNNGESVLCLDIDKDFISITMLEVSKEILENRMLEFLKKENINPKVFEAVLEIALEIGREGREGRQIGTAFLVGDSKKVLESSRQIILNPFRGHKKKERLVTNPNLKETIKEFAQLEGVFVIDNDGIIRAAGRFLNVDTSSIDIPRGLGTRHAVVAAMTALSRAIGITVSQSGGIVRVFHQGKIIFTIDPKRKIFLSS